MCAHVLGDGNRTWNLRIFCQSRLTKLGYQLLIQCARYGHFLPLKKVCQRPKPQRGIQKNSDSPRVKTILMMLYSWKRDHSLSYPRSSLLELSRKSAEERIQKQNTFCLYSLSYILFAQKHTHSLSFTHTRYTHTGYSYTLLSPTPHTHYCVPINIGCTPHTGV